jgi:phage shock protein E
MSNLLSKSSNIDVSISEFKKMLEEDPGIIIDVRTKIEYDDGHLKKTDLLYDYRADDFEDKINRLEKDKTYYLYCRSGNRSGKAARMMRKKGFENVYNIGGFEDLAGSGFEAEY